MLTQQPLPRSTPEAEGIRSSNLLEFVEKLETIPHPNSLMLLRHGKVVAEGWWYPYRQEVPHMLFSLTKSFTSTAVGLAASDGKLSLDETIVSIFPDDVPSKPSANLKAMRIWHLLTMTTGHDQDATQQTLRRKDHNAARGFLAIPVRHKPGTHFVYNSAASQILSLIVQKRTGQTLRQYLTPRLFDPLGIEVTEWDSYADGANFGGWGLSLKTEDIARFGQLCLQDGVWQGQRLLPEGWIETATSKQVENGTDPKNDWNQGYGYQFWRNRGNMYRGDGAFGQFCYVIPEKDAVLAVTSGVGEMQKVMDLVHDILLPALSTDAFPADPQAQERLKGKLLSLRLSPINGQKIPARADKLSGQRFRFEKNHQGMKWMLLDFGEKAWKIVFRDRWGEHDLTGSYSEWSETGDGNNLTAVSGGWQSEDSFEFQLCWYGTPFINTYKFLFDRDHVLCEAKQNVSFDEQTHPSFVGKTDSLR